MDIGADVSESPSDKRRLLDIGLICSTAYDLFSVRGEDAKCTCQGYEVTLSWSLVP